MDEFVERLAGIGVPALVFLIIMSTTGLAGASVISKYGYSAIITATCKKIMQKDNLTNVKNGSKIEVIAEKGKMVILPQKKTLDDMLAMVTSENIHSEISTGSSVGNEEW